MGGKDIAPPLPPSELAQLWSNALDKYQKTTGKAVDNLPSPRTMDEIVGFAEQEKDVFNNIRHPKGKLNAIRAYLGKNIDYIDTAAEFITDATTAMFPPSKALYAAISYMLKTAQKVSAALETIAKCFDEMNTVLETINFLDERKLPNIPGYRTCIMRVFTSLLSIFGISTRYLKSTRTMMWFSKLVKGEDDELKDAYDDLILVIQRLDRATTMSTLQKAVDIEGRLVNVQDGVASGFEFQNAQSKAIEAKQDEMIVALAKFRREVATYRMPKNMQDASKDLEDGPKMMQDSKDKDKGTQKSGVRDGNNRKIVALNLIQSTFSSPAKPSMQYDEIDQLIVPGTSKWFTSEANYYSWLENDDRPVLLIQGEAGVGKTFLAFSLMQELYSLQNFQPNISVAYVFFKEQHIALRSIRWALGAMCSQIAENDAKYCERISTLLDNFDLDKFSTVKTEEIWQRFFLDQYRVKLLEAKVSGEEDEVSKNYANRSKEPGKKTSPEQTAGTIAHNLTRHEHQNSSDDEPILYLVFDGLDELPEASRTLLTSLLQTMKPSAYRVKILLTSRANMDLERSLKDVNPVLLPMSHAKAVDDIRKLAQARCESLSRLRRFRIHNKKQIVSRLQVLSKDQGIGLLYADRALQYLDSIGREGGVLRVLDQLPPDVDSLYAKILSDCSSRRSLPEAEALKLMFASLAFAKTPMTLREIRSFLSMNVADNVFHVEDEIRERSSSLVDLFRSLKYESFGATKSWSWEGPTTEIQAITEGSKDIDIDDDIPLNFQERSLREFFRQPGPFRVEAHTAHLKMFLTCANVLCGAQDHVDESAKRGMESYAAAYWLLHLSDIDLPSATSKQVVLVVELLSRLFMNRNNSAAIIERTSTQMYTQLGLLSNKSTNVHRQNLRKWANSVTLLPKSIFSPEAWSWANQMTSGEEDITYELTKGHVLNWFQTTDVQGAQKVFSTAWLAMRSTGIITSMNIKPGSRITAKQMRKLSCAFDDVKISPQVHRAVCLEQSSWYYKEALKEGKKALSDELPAKDQFHTWVQLSSLCCSLAGADWFNEEDGYDSDEDVRTPYYQAMSKSETRRAHATQIYVEKALSVYPENQVAALAEQERWHVQQAYINLACVKRARGLYEEAIQGYDKARSLGFRQGYCLHEMVVIMSQQRQYNRIIASAQKWSLLDRTYLLALNDQAGSFIHELFQKAAVKAGEEAFMTQVYQELISVLDRDGNAALLRYSLASAHYTILDDLKEAKDLLNELLDGASCKNAATGEDDLELIWAATNMLANVIYKQFRESANYDEKYSLLKELASLPNKQLGTFRGYQIYDSSYAIVYSRMLRKLRPANEFHGFMEQAFQACIDRLTDSQGSNDGPSLSTLARILMTVGGLEKDAKIALSTQFSIVDPSVDHTIFADDSELEEDETSDDAADKSSEADSDTDTDSTSSSADERPKTPMQTNIGKKYIAEIDEDVEDLATDFWIFCDGPCGRTFYSWKEKDPDTKELRLRQIYSCLICANCDLCEDCHRKRLAEDAGIGRNFWRMYCGKNHEYISGPIEGWKGVKDGKIRVGDDEIEFKIWLDGLRGRWANRWEGFWKG